MNHASRLPAPRPAAEREPRGQTNLAPDQGLDRSPRQRAQAALLGSWVAQREVDTSSSPFLPTYGAAEKPGWKDDPGSVAKWAQDEYKADSRRTLVCSMTPDGKIGSIYFPGGRIRTTHQEGPVRESHAHQVTLQFNVNDAEAQKEFEQAFPQLVGTSSYWNAYDEWLATIRLKDCTAANLPAWAKLVDQPDAAHDLLQGPVPQDQTLFEIFKNINGQVESWHPSRGMATKFETDKQTLSVLDAALQHLGTKGLTDPKERNLAFYTFVLERLPRAAAWLRAPP